mmetsp:Transcript_67925/g.107787  ORF Transcript_67925/g.107787 Transcript_67925/m.107787 type:complete len:249 (-) Transcript_67925:280-1026(-)
MVLGQQTQLRLAEVLNAVHSRHGGDPQSLHVGLVLDLALHLRVRHDYDLRRLDRGRHRHHATHHLVGRQLLYSPGNIDGVPIVRGHVHRRRRDHHLRPSDGMAMGRLPADGAVGGGDLGDVLRVHVLGDAQDLLCGLRLCGGYSQHPVAEQRAAVIHGAQGQESDDRVDPAFSQRSVCGEYLLFVRRDGVQILVCQKLKAALFGQGLPLRCLHVFVAIDISPYLHPLRMGHQQDVHRRRVVVVCDCDF